MATQADKVNTGALATIVIVLAISTFGIAAALTALVRYETSVHGAEKGVTANLRAYRDLVNQQRQAATSEARWVDQDKQRVSLPVEKAMELVIRDLQRDANLATEEAPTGALTGTSGIPADQVGMKVEHRGKPGGSGGVTPEQAIKEGGPTSQADTDRDKAQKKPVAPQGETSPSPVP